MCVELDGHVESTTEERLRRKTGDVEACIPSIRGLDFFIGTYTEKLSELQSKTLNVGNLIVGKPCERFISCCKCTVND